MTTVLLTGMPRAGTTLACALLNEHPDTVALVEPINVTPHGDRARALKEIETFIFETRESLKLTGTAISKHISGLVPDNSVLSDSVADGALRPIDVERGPVKFSKPLTAEFCLVIKHPAIFTALAEDLSDRYPLFAVIRDPLSVLASWQTVEMNIQHGHMPNAEAFAPSLAVRLAQLHTPLHRQIAIMEWLLRTYLNFPRSRIIRHEDMLAAPRLTLAAISGFEQEPSKLRRPYAARSRYPSVPLAPLARALRPLAPLVSQFYPNFKATLDQAEYSREA